MADRPENLQAEIDNMLEKTPFTWAKDYNDITQDELVDTYNNYSGYYEQYQEVRDHQGANLVGEYVSKYVGTTDTSIRILDVGCGTGTAAVKLNSLGFTNLDGLDASPKMLELAKEKGIFTNLIHAFMKDCTTDVIADETYHVCVALGIWGVNHIHPGDFDVLRRITKTNGHMLVLGAEDVWQKYPELYVDIRGKIDSMVAAGEVEIVAEDVPDKYYTRDGQWIPSRVILLRKTTKNLM